MPPSEEKKEDQEKVTFAGRRLGQNRLAAKDPFAHLDKPSKPIISEEKKQEPTVATLDENLDANQLEGAPKKLTYEQKIAQERQKGGSLLEMLG